MSAKTVLIADDDSAIRTVLSQALTRAGYSVRSTATAAALWRWVTEGQGDAVVTDVVLPDENAFDVIPRIKKLRPTLPIIVMSAKNTIMTAITAAERGAYPSFEGSLWSRGILPIDSVKMLSDARGVTLEASSTLDWDSLRARVKQHGMRSWARFSNSPRFGSKLPARALDWWVDMYGSAPVSTVLPYLNWAGANDIRADLEHVACPTLVVKSKTPRRSASELDAYNRIPKVEYAEIPVEGYHAAGIDPDTCARAMLEFIGRHP